VKTFRELAVPDPFRYLFFIAGGSLAVENAMKAAFDWKAQKNRAEGVEGGADKVLHFKDAFHGRSGYTLSVTNTDPTKTRDFPTFDWPRISTPFIDFPIDEDTVAAKEATSSPSNAKGETITSAPSSSPSSESTRIDITHS
jgi:L-lysine 6-transaminase